MLLGRSREIALERMKRLDQSRNDAHLWMCLVVMLRTYCIGTWNVRSTNQSKLDMVKKETVRVNSILGIMNENVQDWEI